MTEYSYDNFGNNTYYRRTFRNKSVEKKFQYNNGVLSAKNIVANSGTAMQINNSENYYYKNGSLVAIMLNGNRLVWELQEENNRGQATRVETCGMERAYSYDNYGMPTEIEAGHVQSMSYVFAPSTGNLMSRVDRIHGVGENFAYDNLNRLVKAGNTIVRYSDNGNILERSGVGTFEYGSTDKPYAVTIQRRTSATTCYADERIITYNSFQCPASIRFGATMTYFAYDASGNRICMDTGTDRKYYFDEYEVNESGRQVLYIGGDAYTAPLAFVKRNDASAWKLVNICRDHLGSITDIVDENGERLVTYSYDAWGNMRNPNNWQPYTAANEPALLLGRGYTGHEHIQNLGLINMNARLYDPETGRFLSQDPYVQNTDFTQNFNRYSYCVNNPLSHVDPSGKIAWFLPVIIGAAIGSYVGASVHSGTFAFWNWNSSAWKGAIVGGIIGASIGCYFSSAIHATGMLGTAMIKGETTIVTTKAAGITSSVLFGGTSNIALNGVLTGNWDASWKAGISGMFDAAWGITGGYGLAKSAGKSTKVLAKKVSYQMIGTTLSSIGDNWTNGEGLLSRITMGIGPVNITLGKNQKLLQWQNNLWNIVMNTYGFSNVLLGGKVSFDASNLTFVYTGGLSDMFYDPEEWCAGFSPYVVTGNRELLSIDGMDTYIHETHHLWHSRMLNNSYLLNYALNGINACILNGSFVKERNYYETFADYARWW